MLTMPPEVEKWQTESVWRRIVEDCKSSQKTINCGSALRRKAILEMDRRLHEGEDPKGLA